MSERKHMTRDARDSGALALAPSPEFKALRELSGALDELWSGIMPRQAGFGAAGVDAWMPRVDVRQDDKHYIISAELPGVRKEDVKVQMTASALMISGERKTTHEEKGRHYLRREQSYGRFERRFALPAEVKTEHVKAAFKDGILQIVLAKGETLTEKPRAIDID